MKNKEIIAKMLKTMVDLCEALEAFISEEESAPAKSASEKKPRGRKPKAAKEPEPSIDDFDDEIGGGEDDNDDDDFNFGEEEETGSGLTLDDIRSEFEVFIKKFKDTKTGRANAKKVLAKFKAKSMDTLKEEDYEAVIKVLKTKK